MRQTYLGERTWPSRDEWATNRCTRSFDDECPREYLDAHPIPTGLRAAAMAELDALWKTLAKHIRGAQQPIVDKLLRSRAMSYDDALARMDTPADAALDLRHDIRDDQKHDWVRVSVSYDRCIAKWPEVGAAHPLTHVREYEQACEAQREAAYADWERAVAQMPIDDAAWERELERRRRVEVCGW